MTSKRIVWFVAATTAVLFWATTTQALTLNMVTIGDPGNLGDDTEGSGSVAAPYEIGATEVTVADWVEFLNAADTDGDNDKGLWGGAMQNNMHGGVQKNLAAAEGSRFEVQAGEGNHPINFVNLYDVMRFANWMHNGQGSSDAEDGSYTLSGGKIPTNHTDVTPTIRNPGATWVVPVLKSGPRRRFMTRAILPTAASLTVAAGITLLHKAVTVLSPNCPREGQTVQTTWVLRSFPREPSLTLGPTPSRAVTMEHLTRTET